MYPGPDLPIAIFGVPGIVPGDALAADEEQRIARSRRGVSAPGRVATALCRGLGMVLIRAGQRLQGVMPSPAEGVASADPASAS